MPFPSADSFREAKWLAFFAELTAKLTHHNALVVMEGAELLKRLLISHVSIAAVLQQGDLLVRLLDTWRGCVLAERPRDTPPRHDEAAPSVAVALNDELSFVLAESIAQCIDLMVALHADGDSYYSLLVLARAGPMLEVLVDVLQMAPSQLYGIAAGLLQQLLALPLGRDAVGSSSGGNGEDVESSFTGLDKATVHNLRRSVPLQRHVRSLVEAVQEHGAMLQHTADTLAELLAVQQGPRRFAAIHLFNLTARRLRKYQLRHGRRTAPPAPTTTHTSTTAQAATADNSELNVTITGAAPPQRTSASPVSSSPSPDAVASGALDDLEGGLPARTQPARTTAAATGTTAPRAAPREENALHRSPSPATVNPAHDSAAPLLPPPHDVSAVVDAEPPRLACVVPLAMAEEALRHLAACRSHDAFFDALDWIWCLTVADAAAVGAALSPEALQRGLARYLTAAPRTRRDRVLFTLLLLWLGHLHAVSAVRADTHRAVLHLGATALLPMLRAELTEGEVERPAPAANAASSTSLNVSAITPPTATTIAGTASATLLSTSGAAAAPHLTALSMDPSLAAALHGALPTMSGSTLLPYAAARKAQEAAVLLRPSIAVILLSFVLQMHAGAAAEAQRTWVSQGRVLEIAQAALRRAQGSRSALLDTPVSIDGALSDEVYLDAALRGVRTDATTVAVLGCRLVAAVLGARLRWGGVGLADKIEAPPLPPSPQKSSTTTTSTTQGSAAAAAAAEADVALAVQSLLPLLVDVAVHNPDVAAAQESGAASPVHHVPGNLRCARYTSLGECALAALDACLQHHAQTGHLRSRGEVPMSVAGFAVEDVVRVLPGLTRVSQGSVHPPVRAVPYRLLLYVSHRLDEVLVVLRHMPSLASAAVACVVDYDPRASQWEAAAAAEWLTKLITLMEVAESAQSTSSMPPEGANPPRRRLPTAAELVNEYFHFDDSPMSRKLLALLALGRRGSSMGSAYAMHALMQLTIRLHSYLRARQLAASALCKADDAATAAAAVQDGDAVVLPLRPAGAASAALWVQLLQSVATDNRRLGRISSAFQRACADARGNSFAVVVREAWSRAATVAEQIALQYAFTGAVFEALDALLGEAAYGPRSGKDGAAAAVTWVSPAIVCEAVAAAVSLPTPSNAVALLGTRFHAALGTHSARDPAQAHRGLTPPSSPSPALLHGYQAAVQWASRVGARWLTGAYSDLAGVADASALSGPGAPTQVRGGLPPASRNIAGLVEEMCAGALVVMAEPTPGLSQRTRCLAASLVSAIVHVCPSELLPLLEARGAALFTASAALRRVAAVSGLQCRLLRRVRSAAVCAARDTAVWLADHLAALQHTVSYLKEHAQVPRSAADRSRECRHSPRSAPSPHQRDAGRAAREVQHFEVLVSLLTSLVACTGSAPAAAVPSSPSTGATLMAPEQRQALCAVLCDALRIEGLRGAVAVAVRAMADSAEGRCCLLTEIASAGDPLGRTLFGRLLALTLGMPTRWAGGVAMAKGFTSRSCSPSSTPQDRHRRRTGSRGSPRPSPPATAVSAGCSLGLARTPTRPEAAGAASSTPSAGQAGDVLCAVGCDVCARLCYAGDNAAAAGGEDAATSSTAFLAAFMRHRGLDYLARVVVDCDRVQRRGGHALAVPLHWLRLVAALSSHVSVAKSLVQEADLFSVLLEHAGTPMELHSLSGGAATLALLALRNTCFAEGLKAVLCQDARLLLTLKAACMGLTAVCQLVALPTPHPVSASTAKHAGTTAGAVAVISSPPRGDSSAARADVRLRKDVVDMANKAEVDWAVQACVYARRGTGGRPRVMPTSAAAAPASTQLPDPSAADAAVDSKRKAAGNPPPPRRAFIDISNQRAPAATAMDDGSLLDGGVSLDAGLPHAHVEQDSDLAALERATDAEAPRRRYLAASALASLWFDNQRGRSAIAGVLATVPSLPMEEVHSLLSWSPE